MYALVDCDNFFCSCERVFRPDLNGKPLVVLSNNDGCVVARSAESKAMGIKMGFPYFQLLEQYPHSGITAFSSNYALYADMSARVMALLREETPMLMQYSIDEAFLDMRGCDESKLKAWGEELASRVRRWTGIPVSIGIAPTKTLAKLASRFAKKYPGYKKCCFIRSDSQRLRALQMTEISDVWGIGRRLAASMGVWGITDALQFAGRSRTWVRNHYHLTGERTWRELNGENAVEIDLMEHKRKTIVTSRSFPEMITGLEELKENIANHAARCALKLRRQHTVCSMVATFIQSNYFREDLPQYSNSCAYHFLTPTASTTEIVEVALALLEAIYSRGIHYKRGGVMVSEITTDAAIQPDLFTYNPDMARKYRRLSDAMDEINARLGNDTVILASQQYSATDAQGKHVRFSGAIRRSMKSPDYSTKIDDFKVN